MKRELIVAAVLVCAQGIDWTRLKGVVKQINLKTHSLTIQDRDGDLLTVPIDYQVKIIDKANTLHNLKEISLDEKVILIRTPSDVPADDTEGLVPAKYPVDPQK